MRRVLGGVLGLLVTLPLLALTFVVSGAGESPTVGWTGITIAGGFVACAAIGRRARLAMLVLLVAGVATSIVLFSSLVSEEYESQYEVEHARLGWPFPFVEAELTFTPQVFPQTFAWNPWEHPATANGLAFLASFFTVFVPLLALALGGAALSRRRSARA